MVRATCPSVQWQAERTGTMRAKKFATAGECTMSEQAVEERRGWASDVMWVVLYSILVLLAMLLWV